MNPKQLRKQFYLDSLYHFNKFCLGYKDMVPHVHGPICNALQEMTTRKLICVPRGTFKSTNSTIGYPIWLLEKNPNLRILLDSEIYSNSKNFLREIKGHYEHNRDFRELFGDRVGPLWNEDEIILSTRKIHKKEPSIVCSGIGAGKTSQHYDCLVKGTMIYTSNGWKPIEQIEVGNRVLGNNGKFNSVIAKQSKESSKDLISIRSGYQAKSVSLTEDHKIYIYRDGNFLWEEAKNITKKDMLCFPKITGKNRQISKTNKDINKLMENNNMWRFIGYWLAEGCHTNNCKNGIRLTFGSHEDYLIEDCVSIIRELTGKNPSVKKTNSSTKIIIFSDNNIKEILSKFGTHAYNKHLPPFVLNAHTIKQRELIKGYFLGDGCHVGKTISFSSTSLGLLSGIQFILATHDISSGISQCKKEGKSIILGKECKIRDAYNLCSTANRLKDFLGINGIDYKWEEKPIRSFFTDKYWVVPVISCKRESSNQVVYDITVKDVHCFVTMAGITHNCIIADDLSSYKNITSKDLAQKTIDHYRLYTSLLDPGGTLVIIGTRYSQIDIIGFVIENELGIKGGDVEKLRKLYCKR